MQRIRTWVISITEPEDKTVGWIDSLITDEKLDWEFKLWQGGGWKVLKTAEGITPDDAREIASELDNALKEELEEEIAQKYTKPASGIPKTDLTEGVQSALDKADSAVQPADVPVEKGAGTNSVQQKNRNVLALGEGAVATGEGETIEFTLIGVTEVGDGLTRFHVSESVDNIHIGDALHYVNVEAEQDFYTKIATVYTTEKYLVATERFTPTPTVSGGTLTVERGIAKGLNSTHEGAKNTAMAGNTHAEGFYTRATQVNAHSEGTDTLSSGYASHAEGQGSHAEKTATHAEGNYTTAGAEGAHSEGGNTKAMAEYSHSEGINTEVQSKVENIPGFGPVVFGAFAGHAEGNSTKVKVQGLVGGYVANGQSAHAEGYMTEVHNLGEHAEGRCNKSNTLQFLDPTQQPTQEQLAKMTLHSVGIGTPNPEHPDDPDQATRANAFEIMQNGDAYLFGSGGFNGTNAGQSGIKTLQTLISEGSEVFVATYGTTTAAEILAAYNAGKVVVCFFSSNLYYLTRCLVGGTTYYFTAFLLNSLYYLALTVSTNTWNNGVLGLQALTEKVTSLSSASTDQQYPSAKCVYDAIFGAMDANY